MELSSEDILHIRNNLNAIEGLLNNTRQYFPTDPKPEPEPELPPIVRQYPANFYTSVKSPFVVDFSEFSSWQKDAPVDHPLELTNNGYLLAGALPMAFPNTKPGGTYNGDFYENTRFTGMVTFTNPKVLVLNCVIQADNYKGNTPCGTSPWAVVCADTALLVDVTLLGGLAASASSGTIVRGHLKNGKDGFKISNNLRLIETVVSGQLPQYSDDHHDGGQFNMNSGSHFFDVWKSVIRVGVYETGTIAKDKDGSRKSFGPKTGNAPLQFGDTGATLTVRGGYSVFVGGNGGSFNGNFKSGGKVLGKLDHCGFGPTLSGNRAIGGTSHLVGAGAYDVPSVYLAAGPL